MAIHTVIFIACLAAAAGYALVRGGLPERIIALEITVAAFATEALALSQRFSFQSLAWSELILDTTLLAALVPVALFANRYWPMWAAAVQLDTIAMHGVRAYDPSLRASVYFVMAGYAAYPILILLALGTLRHRERSARAGQSEAAWIV